MATLDQNIEKIAGTAIKGTEVRTAIADAISQVNTVINTAENNIQDQIDDMNEAASELVATQLISGEEYRLLILNTSS